MTPEPFFAMWRATAFAVINISRIGGDRLRKVGERELRERHTLDVKDPDRIQGDIDAARHLRHRSGVVLDGTFVERIDLRRLSEAAQRRDIERDRLELCWRAPGEEHLRAFTREGTGGCAAVAPPAP